ncbi:MAG: hypothetical protein Q7R83_00950 [bacterium]|nr:hypothetical protein [bacterium]
MIHHAPLSSGPQRLPVAWIWVWFAIGLVVLVGSFIFLTLTEALNRYEVARFQACEEGKEVECQPSVYWFVNGLQLSPGAAKTVDERSPDKDVRLPNGLIQQPTPTKKP